ncbi:unnamed protein product [Peronospora farinosa]|uniref:GB1/RHD3-type G domain-containing protein n=1 Tax=Peronospora farinosa TaxID=134698 RepID=A0ABN8CC68_9STRA|nr:unnamed protein product [Peronospora farinosa]
MVIAMHEFPEEPVPLITFGKDEEQLKINEESVEASPSYRWPYSGWLAWLYIKFSASVDEKEDEDVMQFHNFFPSFLWVVRDFTLELVDEDGDEILE